MNIDPRYEIGVDYEGVSPRHLQVGEVHEFSNEVSSRIFMPSLGSFYVESAKITDRATGVELVRNVDYKTFILDDIATERSGKEACGIIEVIDPECTGVIIDYQFVGGLHISGYYILRQLVQMYPDGVNAIIEWSNVLNKPLLYEPSYHAHHVREIFDSKELAVMIERIRSAIVTNKNSGLVNLYNNAQNKIDELYNNFDSKLEELKDSLEQTFKSLQIQGQEIIMTDNPENPAIKRKYGEWVLMTNSVLHGAGVVYVIGSGFMIDMGTEQIVRNVYIWKNVTGDVNTPTVTTTADKEVINEGDEITFTVTMVNVPANLTLGWVIRNADDMDLVGSVRGTFESSTTPITVTVKFAKDRRTDGDRDYTFQIESFPSALVHFKVLDTSKTKQLNMAAFSNGNVINDISEDEEFDLLLWGASYSGQTVNLSYSGLNDSEVEFESLTTTVYPYPTGVKVRTKGNAKIDPERFLVIDARDQGDTDVANSVKLFVHDTSQFINVAIAFLTNNMVVNSLNEGAIFQIRIKTNAQPGTELKLEYASNKDLSEFSGLLDTVVVGVDSAAYVDASLIYNNTTATVQEFLTVNVLANNVVISSQSININDTSKNVEYSMYFASDVEGDNPITSIEEGNEFYLVVKIPTWNDRSYLKNDFDYSFDNQNTTLAQLRGRLDGNLDGQIEFGESSIDGVNWRRGFIQSRRLLAKANERVDNDQAFVVKIKPESANGWSKSASITIIDSSTGKLEAYPTDTAGNRIPNLRETSDDNKNFKGFIHVTSVDPIQNFNRLEIDIPEIYKEDFKTQFPVLITGVGNDFHFPVEVRLDNKTEGVETIPFNIIYTTTTGAKITQTSFIDILDTSTRVPLNLSASSPSGAVGKFSQWSPINLTVNSFVYGDPSLISYSINYRDGRDASARFSIVDSSQRFPVNVNNTTMVITPKIMDADISDNLFTVSVVRSIDGVDVTETATLDFELRNDGQPESIKLQLYTDEGRTILAPSTVDEGKTYYGKITVNNSRNSGVLIVNNPFSGKTLKTGNDWFTGRNEEFVTENFSMRVLATVAKATQAGDQFFNFTFKVINDRSTNYSGGNRWLRLTAFVDKVTSGDNGVAYPNETAPVGSLVTPDTDLLINDLSKTAQHSVTFTDEDGNVKSSFNEGEVVIVNVRVNQGTIGDELVINPTGEGGVFENRFSYAEFNEPKVITNNIEQTLKYRCVLLEDYTTNSGTGRFTVVISNRQSGLSYRAPSWYVLINDTSKGTTITGGWYLVRDNSLRSSIDEGQEAVLRVYTDIKRPNDKFTVEIISGRPDSDLDINELNTTKVINDSRFAEFRFRVKRNKIDDPVNFLRVSVAYAVDGTELVSKEFQVTINDTSRSLKILEGIWADTSSNNLDLIREKKVTSINEGQAVYLHLITDGGNESYSMVLDNDGGRDPNRIVYNVYGTNRGRNSNNTSVSWGFNILKDGKTNTGNNTKLKVKVQSADDPSIVAYYELPINDLSTDTVAEVEILSDTTDTPITSIDEGVFFRASFKVTNPKPNVTYTYRVRSAHSIIESSGWSSSVASDRSQTYTTPNTGADQTTHVGRIKYELDNLTNQASALDAFVEVLEGNVVIASTILKINDVSRSPTVVKVDISTSPSQVVNTADGYYNEGSTYYIHVVLENYTHSSFKLKYDGPNTTGAIKMIEDQYLEMTGQTTPDLATQLVVFEFKIAMDEDTVPSGEDTPSAYFRAYNPNNEEIGSTICVIRNKSPLPEIKAVIWTDSENSNTPITSTYEGQVIYLVVLTKGISTGTPITVDLRESSVNLDDFVGLDSLTKTINVTTYDGQTAEGRAFLRLVTKRDDVFG